MVNDTFDKIKNNISLSKEDAKQLLNIDDYSEDYYKLLYAANSYSRKQFNNKGTIFSQIGLDSQKCPINCKFCSFASDTYNGQPAIKPLDVVLKYVDELIKAGTNELFVMSTASFSQDMYLTYLSKIREIVPKDINLVANIGDFDIAYANALKEIGATGVYHICRLGEGIDTSQSVDIRVKTINAAISSGLELYYCVEPIGPEHSDEQIIEEIFRAKQYNVNVMAVMKRVCVPGTNKYNCGEITNAKLAKICAVTTLCVQPKRAMGVHEPDELCLISGANQIYAETGSNPRDLYVNTQESRGFSVSDAKKLLSNTGWYVYEK